MNEGQVKPLLFPTYPPPVITHPTGMPVAHPKQAAFLMKAIKSVGKIASRSMPKHSRKSLRNSQSIHIKHKKIGYL